MGRFGLIAGIVAIAAAIGLSFIPGPQGLQGKKGEPGDRGLQGPAITNEALQLAVNTAVEAKIANLPKALTAEEIQKMIPVTPAYDDKSVKAEIETLKVKITEAEKNKAEPPVVAIPSQTTASSGTGWSEEIRETDDLKSNNLGWKVVGGYKFPMAKNKRGLPSPINGDSEPTWIAAGDWKYLDFKLPNGAVVKAWALPK